MAYLVQSTVPFELTIGSRTVTDRLVSFNVSDSSAYRNGIIATSGSIVLGTVWDEDPESLYGASEFRRGDMVRLSMLYPDGATGNHPRGTLRVLACSYSPAEEQTLVEVGCEITYKRLIDDMDDVIEDFAPIPLEPARNNAEGLSAALAAYNEYIYADANGDIVSGRSWGKDGGRIGSPAFTCIRGVTVLSITPLSSSEAIPDTLEITYQVPAEDEVDEDDAPYETEDISTSYYFLTYPAIRYSRLRLGGLDDSIEDEIELENLEEGTNIIEEETPCGPKPEAPPEAETGEPILDQDGIQLGEAVPFVCSDYYVTVKSNFYIPAVQTTIDRSEYHGPAAQNSFQSQETWGPLLQIQNQYFADQYDYCRRVYGHPCNGNGGCPKYGIDGAAGNQLLQKTLTYYYYGSANEVVRTVTDTYDNMLSIATTSDWLSGNPGGAGAAAEKFDQNFAQKYNKLFLSRRVIQENNTSRKANIKETTTLTYTSASSRQRGLLVYVGSNRVVRKIDAMDGIKTMVVQQSSTTQALDTNPDRLSSEVASTVDLVTTRHLSAKQTGAGQDEYIRKESVPYPYLEKEDEGESEEASAKKHKELANNYGRALAKFVIGDARGFQLGEALRRDIADSWEPSVSFAYYDDKHKNKLLMKMDATSWAVDVNGSAVVTNALFASILSGTISDPHNLVGDIAPDMGDGVVLPPPVDPQPPIIIDTVPVEDFILDIDYGLALECVVDMPNGDGLVELPDEFDGDTNVFLTQAYAVRGMLVQPGALVGGGPSGSMPIDWDGILITQDDLVINPDLFSNE